MFKYLRTLVTGGLIVIRKNLDDMLSLIQIMASTVNNSTQSTNNPQVIMPCFKNLVTLESEIRQRVTGGRFGGGKNEMEELADRIIF